MHPVYCCPRGGCERAARDLWRSAWEKFEHTWFQKNVSSTACVALCCTLFRLGQFDLPLVAGLEIPSNFPLRDVEPCFHQTPLTNWPSGRPLCTRPMFRTTPTDPLTSTAGVVVFIQRTNVKSFFFAQPEEGNQCTQKENVRIGRTHWQKKKTLGQPHKQTGQNVHPARPRVMTPLDGGRAKTLPKPELQNTQTLRHRRINAAALQNERRRLNTRVGHGSEESGSFFAPSADFSSRPTVPDPLLQQVRALALLQLPVQHRHGLQPSSWRFRCFAEVSMANWAPCHTEIDAYWCGEVASLRFMRWMSLCCHRCAPLSDH